MIEVLWGLSLLAAIKVSFDISALYIAALYYLSRYGALGRT